MSLLRKSYIDLDWPSWMATRFPFDRFDGWTDMGVDAGIRVEEFEKDGNFVIRAEAPGIDPDKASNWPCPRESSDCSSIDRRKDAPPTPVTIAASSTTDRSPGWWHFRPGLPTPT